MSVTLYTPSSSQIVHEARVDFRQRVIQSMIHIVQYDKSLPVVAVELYSNGQKWALPDAVTAVKVRWGKRDHTYVHRDVLGCNENRTIVYMEITEQMTIFYGEHNPVLEVLIGDNVACSSYIPFYIDRNPIQRNDIESIDDPSIVEELQREIATKLGKVNFGEVLTDNIYDSTSSYEEGDVVYYGSYLYEALVDIPSPAGNFDETKWKKTTVTNLLLNEGVASVNGRTGDVVLTKNDVGLGNVDNTSDANKPVSTAQQAALDLKEDKSNKITSWGTPTNTQYPSAKLVKDDLDKLEAEMNEASTDVTDSSMSKVSGVSDGLALPPASQMEMLSIKGNTIAWNQLVTAVIGSDTVSGVTFTHVDDRTLTISGTANSRVSCTVTANGIAVQPNHRYLIFGMEKNSQNIGLIFNGYSTSGWVTTYLGKDTGEGIIVDNTNADVTLLRVELTIESGTALSKTYTIKPKVVDLTIPYPTDTPTSVSDPRVQWCINFALEHPEYNAGSLVNVGLTAYETKGINQWDEEWEVGIISNVTGQNASSSSNIRSKNYIKVIPNTTYSFYNGRYFGGIFQYDANKNYITDNWNGTTLSNCAFIRFFLDASYGTTYNHDICINVSNSAINGQYFPYVKHTYPLSYNGKSAGSVQDEKLANGKEITRVGTVDLGTLDYTYHGYGFYFAASIIGSKSGTSNGICSNGFVCRSYTTPDDDGVIGFDGNGIVYIQAKQYGTDVSAFKAAMSGVILNYELATPTETDGDPLPNAIAVYQGGTEWQINDGAPATITKNYDISIKDQVMTNVKVDARQEEEIEELRQTDYKTLYNLGEFDTVDTSNKDYDLITRNGWYVDLGTLDYVLDNGMFRSSSIPNKANNKNFITSAPYTTVSTWSECRDTDKTIYCGGTNNDELCIHDSAYSNATTFKGAMSGVPLYYQLATPYTEKVIKNRPINTLDQNGSMFVRKEWEKGLNLYSGENVSFSSSINTSGELRILLWEGSSFGMIYNTSSVGFKTIYFGKTSSVTKISFYIGGNNEDFIETFVIDQLPNGTYNLSFVISGNTYSNVNISQIMLNEGSHPYPYQPYNGDIVREKDVNGTLLWENGNPTSSFAAQTITIADSSKFKYLVISYGVTSVSGSNYAKILNKANPNGESGALSIVVDVTVGRTIQINSSTSISFSDGYRNGVVNNERAIPFAIYGTNVL